MKTPGIEILAFERTVLGILCLRQRTLLSDPGVVVTEVTLNHEFLMSSYHTASERALARRSLELRPGESLDVLVGGLGLGYTASEVLASPRVARAEVVEFLPQVIGWFDQGLVPLAKDLKADPRFVVTRGDVYERLSGSCATSHDLILIDVDHGPDAPLSGDNLPFYTPDGVARAKRHLKTGGVLAVWSFEDDAAFTDALRGAFAQVRVEPVAFRNDLIDEDETNWLFLAWG